MLESWHCQTADSVLGFAVGLGVAGLWWGMAATATLQGAALATVVGSFDWPQEAARAAARVVGAERGLTGAKQENMFKP